jgi:hypothetical protein
MPNNDESRGFVFILIHRTNEVRDKTGFREIKRLSRSFIYSILEIENVGSPSPSIPPWWGQTGDLGV